MHAFRLLRFVWREARKFFHCVTTAINAAALSLDSSGHARGKFGAAKHLDVGHGRRHVYGRVVKTTTLVPRRLLARGQRNFRNFEDLKEN